MQEMTIRDALAWITLLSGYAKWGYLKSAGLLFDLMPEKNHVSRTALSAGYAINYMGNKALELFTKMMWFQIRPDQFTSSSCFCGCASIVSRTYGKQIHAYLIQLVPNLI